MTVFQLSPMKRLLAQVEMPQAVYATPVAAGGVLYITASSHLFAIAQKR